MADQKVHTESQRMLIGRMNLLLAEVTEPLANAEMVMDQIYHRFAASECYDDYPLDRQGVETDMDLAEKHIEGALKLFRANRAKITSSLEKRRVW